MKRIFLFILPFLLPAAVFSAATEWTSNPQGGVRLIAPYNVALQEGPIQFGFHFKTAPGWVVYWKDSGDVGFPPKFDFKGSRGFKNPEILWPRPKYFLLPGDIKEYGYEGEVVYPVKATAVREGNLLHIVADVSYLTCRESCIPYRYTLTLDVPKGDTAQIDPEIDVLLLKYIAQVPPAQENVLASLRPERVHLDDSPAAGGLGWMLLLGFLGGLILNVMPCVLPVLSIKLVGLLQHGGRDRRIVARDALASTAGILFSFIVGAGLIILAQRAGAAVGWGVQFQSPGFVAFLTALVALFALNLWGVFEINLPPALTRVGALGQSDEGPLSFFVSGMFATLLATPCSAPFLGTAMGFALSQTPGVILAIFTAAGLGMSLPYIVLTIFPKALRWLPKPGRWMGRLKIFLGLLLAGTALWLSWVFVQQVGWVKSAPITAGPIEWVPFEEEKIDSWVASGKAVFVDVTAEWCLTCKVNERFVLQDPEVVAEFKKRGVVMMLADWTNQDTGIGRYLAKHGRAGIPFYALYRPGREPVLFSELLRKKHVLRELEALTPSDSSR
jgi:thiol:disulfide interchange protein